MLPMTRIIAKHIRTHLALIGFDFVMGQFVFLEYMLFVKGFFTEITFVHSAFVGVRMGVHVAFQS